MADALVAVVTGANRGIGKELARGLAAHGCTVWLGSRHLLTGQAVDTELSGDGAVSAVELGVTDDASVAAATERISSLGRVDILVNNAGIGGSRPEVDATTAADVAAVLDVNLLGAVRLTHSLPPLPRNSRHPRIINVTNGRWSFAINSDPKRMESRLHRLVYPVSKTALNMLTYHYARALPTFRINAVDPGFTAMALNNHTGVSTPAHSAHTIVRLALGLPDGPTGRLFDATGVIGW